MGGKFLKNGVVLFFIGTCVFGCGNSSPNEASTTQAILNALPTPKIQTAVQEDKPLDDIGNNTSEHEHVQQVDVSDEALKNRLLDYAFFMENGRYDFAVETCEEILKIDPGNQDAKAKLVLAQRKNELAKLNTQTKEITQENTAKIIHPKPLDIQKLLNKKVSIEFQNIHIEHACKFITDMHKLPISIDWEAVNYPNVRGSGANLRDDPNYARKSNGIIKYVHRKDVELSDALKAMLQPIGLDYKVYSDYVWISSPAMLNR